MQLITEWTQTKDYEHRLTAGPFVVAEVHHSAAKPLDRDKPWVVSSLLPGMEMRGELRYATEAEAKAVAEKAVTHWFNSALRDT